MPSPAIHVHSLTYSPPEETVPVIPYTSTMFHPRLFHANDGLDEIVEGLRPYAGYHISFGDMYVHTSSLSTVSHFWLLSKLPLPAASTSAQEGLICPSWPVVLLRRRLPPTGPSLIWPIVLISVRTKDAGLSSSICWYLIALVFQDQV
jgi:hypothetical protein